MKSSVRLIVLSIVILALAFGAWVYNQARIASAQKAAELALAQAQVAEAQVAEAQVAEARAASKQRLVRSSGDVVQTEPGVADAESALVAPDMIEFPRDRWDAAGIQLESASLGELSQTLSLTGKVALNEDHVAHIFPLVEGRVEEVKVQFGDRVKKGDVLVIVQSREVGQSLLQLYKDRIQRDYVQMKDRWTQEVTRNTLALIELIRNGADLNAIEAELSNRSLGEYRDKLMSAYIAKYKSGRDVQRLEPLTKEGAVAQKQLLAAETDLNAAAATLQSFMEQIEQDAKQASLISAQSVKEAETTVAVDETNLRIIGFQPEQLVNIDPTKTGEAVSHYPIIAPFDGTIISKDVVLLERVGPERQILSIADLSTVWVSADIFEENLASLETASHKRLTMRSAAWPDQVFEADIFYTGDIVDETSRTISLRALADNPKGYLKPGMFLNISLPTSKTAKVLQVPASSVLEHEGVSFVFVHTEGDRFQRRQITAGSRSGQTIQILSGLTEGEKVVVRGGFALKSRMLAELLEE